jgi:hypothetical protein
MTAFFRVLAVEYGAALAPKSLRLAIMAHAAHELPPEQFQEKSGTYKSLARRVLIRNLGSSGKISEADMIASCVLLCISSLEGGSLSEVATHAAGCLAILQNLQANSQTTRMNAVFAVFGPFVLARLHVFVSQLVQAHYPGVIPRLLAKRTTFKERIRYNTELCRMLQLPIDEGIGFALAGSIGDYILMLECCVGSVAEREKRHLFDRGLRVQALLDSIMAALCDPDFQLALNLVNSSFHNDYFDIQKSETDQAYLIKDEIQILKGIHLAKAILEFPTLLQGFKSPKANSMAKSLISGYSELSLLRGVRKRSFYIRHHLFGLCLGALALGWEDDTESKF